MQPAENSAPKDHSKWISLVVIALGTLMSGINASSLNVANPLLSVHFRISLAEVQWVTTIYLLVVSVLMLLLGRVGDRVGGHKIYLCGLVVFSAGSVCCGFSGALTALLLSRALQAVGAAMLMATGAGIIVNAFPLSQRGMALGINVLVVGIGGMCGPTIGGLILTHFTWPVIFFVNVPFGLLSLLVGLRYLRSNVPPPQNPPPLDIRGALLLGVIISSLILFFSGNFAGSRWFGLLFLLALPVFAMAEKKHAAPLWDSALLANPRFSLGNLVAFLSYFANMAVNFLLPFFLQEQWELPVGAVGWLMMISPLCMAVTAPLSGVLSDRIGAMRLMPAALVVFMAALVLMLFLGPAPVIPHFAAGLALMGCGMGMLNTPNNSEIMTAAGRKYAGYAGGFVATNRNLAFCIGTAASAGVFTLLRQYFALTRPYADAYQLALRCIIAAAALVALLSLAICLRLKTVKSPEDAAGNGPRP
ncbi:MAG: MFS transporter [Gracilibacteraceae bacterium]|jgi:EmrB/QacA subfamily drug resistance transporter|nr:MFS transporter [Gracilibacteraceae bacterium]